MIVRSLPRASWSRIVLVAALAASCLAAAPPRAGRAAEPRVATLAPDALRPGQKAIVRTVFQGTRVEEFEAEIVGVMKGGRTDGDLILARATTERVVKSGVAQGMSGSPVYVDGKLIGALSSGWAFNREPLFGVTPIGEMFAVLDLPERPAGGASVGPGGVDAPAATDLAYAGLRWDDPDPSPAAPPEATRAAAGPRPLLVPLACSGLAPAALPFARAIFEPLGFAAVPGGQAARGGVADTAAIVPGSAVAVDIMRGDLALSAIGTVTWREGDRVLIFGHPLFQAGDVRLPMSSAEITTIVPSDQFAFKLGVRGRSLGELTQDRRTAMAGRLGAEPRLLPLAVTVRAAGRAPQRFRFQSVEDRTLAPQILPLAAMNSVLESGGTGAGQTVRWSMRLHRRGAPALTLDDVAAGESPAVELGGALAAPLRFLFNNPFGAIALDSVSVLVDVTPGRDSWTLRTARLVRPAVRPGEAARVRCEVERWRGERRIVELDITIPEEVPDGRYVVWIGGGAELTRYEAARLPGRFRPTSLDEAWRRLADVRPAEHLYATAVARAPEVTSGGRDYPELPASAMALLADPQVAGDAARRGDRVLFGETRARLPGVVRGELQLEVNVDSKAP